jgi:hypothetical protein
MDWSIKSENYKRIYDYFSRKNFNVDERFFHDLTYQFVRIYKDIQKANCVTKYKTDKIFQDYFPIALIDSCRTVLKLVPEDSREELSNIFERNLRLPINGNTSLKKAFGYQKRWIVKAKTQAVYGKLDEYCKKILDTGIVWGLHPTVRNKKQVYKIPNNSLEYFTSRIIQQKLKQEYNLSLSNRNLIIEGLVENLGDDLPKSIIRTDIIGFYESIDQSMLIKKLSSDGKLPVNQLKAIKSLLYEYREFTNQEIGLPRGNGISAYLTEVLLKDFDLFVKRLENVIFYARFVDDIIVVVKENDIRTTDCSVSVWGILQKEIQKLSLRLHPRNTKTMINCTIPSCSFDYLGYHFCVSASQIDIGMAISKIQRYKTKISIAFWHFYKDRNTSYGRKTTLLRNRLRYLTLETRLSGMKKGIRVGLKATYPKLTDFSCLDLLDDFLEEQKQYLPQSCAIKLNICNFKKGYNGEKRTHFSLEQLGEVVSIWSGI